MSTRLNGVVYGINVLVVVPYNPVLESIVIGIINIAVIGNFLNLIVLHNKILVRTGQT